MRVSYNSNRVLDVWLLRYKIIWKNSHSEQIFICHIKENSTDMMPSLIYFDNLLIMNCLIRRLIVKNKII